jgi:hypothetical protein
MQAYGSKDKRRKEQTRERGASRRETWQKEETWQRRRNYNHAAGPSRQQVPLTAYHTRILNPKFNTWKHTCERCLSNLTDVRFHRKQEDDGGEEGVERAVTTTVATATAKHSSHRAVPTADTTATEEQQNAPTTHGVGGVATGAVRQPRPH